MSLAGFSTRTKELHWSFLCLAAQDDRRGTDTEHLFREILAEHEIQAVEAAAIHVDVTVQLC